MQTTTLPEIDESDLKAVREFLTSQRDEEGTARTPHSPLGPHRRSRGQGQVAVPVRNGIARARTRSGNKTGS
jgi:hypothetical protein